MLNERVKREVLGLDEELELLKEQILEEEVWVEHLREKEEGGEEEKGEEEEEEGRKGGDEHTRRSNDGIEQKEEGAHPAILRKKDKED